MPHVPLAANEDDRLAALQSYNILDTAEEKDFDELTALASAICKRLLHSLVWLMKSVNGLKHTQV